jgi:hypothetical protein
LYHERLGHIQDTIIMFLSFVSWTHNHVLIRQGANRNYKKLIRDLNIKLQWLKYNFGKV